METKKILRKRPVGLTYNSKNKNMTDEERKLLRKEQNRKYYLQRKEIIQKYNMLLEK